MRTGQFTFLTIDDNHADARLIEHYVSRIPELDVAFIHVEDARAGRKALSGNDIDLVFLDYQLGDIDGIEVLRALRRGGMRCPIILMTGQGSEHVAAESRRAGGDDYLPKGELSPDILRRSILQVLEAHKDEQSQRGFEETLSRMATRDSLTGLLNRRHFLDQLALEAKRTERYERPLCLMALDVDDFGKVNDTFDSNAGDAVIAQIAQLLRHRLRVTDHFCRYHGDCFCIALTATTPETALQVAQRVWTSVAAMQIDPTHSGKPISITCTVALRPIISEDIDVDSAILDAFAAISRAKTSGGNQVVMVHGDELS